MIRRAPTRAWLGLVGVLAGCAATTTPATTARSAPVLPADALAIPVVQQATDYSCGAAALLAILSYWQVFDGTEQELYAALDVSPENGTAPDAIVRVAGEHGLDATLRQHVTIDELRAALARNDTVIVDLQAWPDGKPSGFRWATAWEDGHYVVLVAADATYVYVMDPSAGYGFLPIRELLDRWHDYEVRDGRRIPYVHAAIFLHGRTPLDSVGALIRIDEDREGSLNTAFDRIGCVFVRGPKQIEVPTANVGRVVAYIHNNPVRAGVVTHAEASTWTSHRAYVGLVDTPGWLHTSLGLQLAGMAAESFGTFVAGNHDEFDCQYDALVHAPDDTCGVAPTLHVAPELLVTMVADELQIPVTQLCSPRRGPMERMGREVAARCAPAVGLTAVALAREMRVTQQAVSLMQKRAENDEALGVRLRVLERLRAG